MSDTFTVKVTLIVLCNYILAYVRIADVSVTDSERVSFSSPARPVDIAARPGLARPGPLIEISMPGPAWPAGGPARAHL